MTDPHHSLEADNQQIQQALATLKKHHTITQVTEAEEADIQERLSQFKAFSAYQDVFIYGGVRLGKAVNTYFVVTSLNHQQQGLPAYQGQVPGMTELAYAGLTTLRHDYGTATIRPESTTERLIEYIYPTKIRFEAAPKLHQQYRVMADDPDYLKNHLPEPFLKALQQYEGLTIEFQGHDLLVRLPQGLGTAVAEQLVAFLMRAREAG